MTIELVEGARKPDPADPELQSLPGPRRPWRRVTLLTLSATLAGALLLGFNLAPQAKYALRGAEGPLDLGDLAHARLDLRHSNRWVHGVGALQSRAAAYRRPLVSGQFRLAPLLENEKIWIELRVPDELDPQRFIPPTSFVGRLVPLSQAGMGYPSLSGMGLDPALNDAWILLDGESPGGTRWVFGVLLLLGGFCGFCLWALHSIVRSPGAHS